MPVPLFNTCVAVLTEAISEVVYWTCVRYGVAQCIATDVDLVAHAWWWAVTFHGCVPTISVAEQVCIICNGFTESIKFSNTKRKCQTL